MRTFIYALLFSLTLLGPVCARAQTAEVDVPEATASRTYTYEQPSLRGFAKLYWALGAHDIADNTAIDNFLMITECDLYRKYIINEFQWNEIRENMREFLKENKTRFPVRFEIVQPLRLGQYDFKRGGFAVAPGYEIKGVSRYEVMTDNAYDSVCGGGAGSDVPGYPKALVTELSRPINLDFIPMDPEKARSLIEKKQQGIGRLDDVRGEISDYRDAYLVLKLNIFGYKGESRSMERQLTLAHVLASLEVLEVYTDEKLTQLVYKEDYLRRKNISSTEMRLRKERETQKLKEREAAAPLKSEN